MVGARKERIIICKESIVCQRHRRSFTAQFKREAVQMIQKQGLSVAETARRLKDAANQRSGGR